MPAEVYKVNEGSPIKECEVSPKDFPELAAKTAFSLDRLQKPEYGRFLEDFT